jgi:N-acyl-D-amino-acid deacylase
MRLIISCAVALLACAAGAAAQPHDGDTAGREPFDILVLNGRLLDGTGNPWVRGDIGIRDGRIAAIGALQGTAAARTIDAAGRYVTPGFIDVHSHAGEGLARAGLEQGRPLLAQGVTTIVANPDGSSPIDLRAQRERFEALGLGVNVALLVGHGSVRREVLGLADRAPTTEELARMQALVRRGMDEGAFGLSTGLFYTPGSFSTTEEVVELMKVVAGRGGLHTSHIRDEGSYDVGLLAAVEETIRIAEETGTVGIVSHMKALGPDSWGLAVPAIMRIEAARARGVQVFVDQYPYEASSTSLLAAIVPRRAQAGGADAMRARFADPATRPRLLAEMRENIRRRGGPESLVVAHYGPERAHEGRHLGEIASSLGLPPEEAVLALIAEGGVSIVSFNMHERDVEHVMRQPFTMTSSDGGLVFPTEGKPHPRNYGAHARKLARYARDRQVVSVEDAIRSMTSLPALVFGLPDRGTLRAGAWADLAIFDLAAIEERGTYLDPHHLAAGMSYVIVNGTIVLDEGEFTAALPGWVLRKRGGVDGVRSSAGGLAR